MAKLLWLLLTFIGVVISGCGGGGTGDTNNNVPTFNISGSVVSGANKVEGAKVLLSGMANAVAFTNSSGNYTFRGLGNGNYSVTAVKPAYSCTPRSMNLKISGGNMTEANFTATTSLNIFYVVDGRSQLATVNTATKEVRIIGNVGIFINDISFAPNGELFGVSVDSLYKIDKTTAAPTLVGPLGVTNPTSLEFNSSGTLYTATYELYSISLLNGVARMIGNGGIPYHSSGDIAFLGNKMYMSSNVDPNNDSLLEINPLTGAATLVGPIGYSKVYGLATNDNVTLYAFTEDKVITIDTTTGAGTALLDLGGTGLASIDGAAAY